ncbi:MAG: DUF5808 domain-containing protein [Limisphaerales bacterium]
MKLIDLDWPLIIAALFSWGSIAAFALMTPRVSRPDLFFAVTVNPSFRQSSAGRGILRRYDGSIIVVALLALLLVGLVNSHFLPLKIAGLLGPILVGLTGCFGAFLVARHQTLPHHVEPSAEREAELQPRQVSLPGGWLAQAGPFVILGVIGLGLWLQWDNIPARIPIHWGGGGRPDGWAAKSPASVFGSTAIGALACLLLAGLWSAMVRGVRRIHSSGQRAIREARFLRAISLFVLGTEYWMASLMGLLSLAALRANLEAPLTGFWFIFLGQTLLIAAVFLIAYRAGQGGWRWGLAGQGGTLKADDPPVGDRTPDACWKLGLFYFNQEDPALFVEKRFGVGWTLNFANPRSWLVIGAVLFFILAVLGLALLTTTGGDPVGRAQ